MTNDDAAEAGEERGMETKTVYVELCIPVTVKITGWVDDDDEIHITHSEVPGESFGDRRIFENVADGDLDYLVDCLRVDR